MLTPVVTACGGSDPVNRALVSDPLSIDFSQDGEAIVIRLQNVHDAPVRLTEIEVVENSLVLLHDPLPWRLATNGEAATSVSVNAIAGAQADVIQIRGPNILLRTPVTHPACDFDGDRVRAEACSGDDCDDRNPAVSPTATEVCNGTHDNVNGVVDENLDVFTLYADNNNDRYGDPDVGIESCDQIDGYVENFGDCSDNNPTIDPDADEFCTGIDQNCDGLVDYSAVDRRILYADSDSDGFGNPDIFARACPGTLVTHALSAISTTRMRPFLHALKNAATASTMTAMARSTTARIRSPPTSTETSTASAMTARQLGAVTCRMAS